MPVSAVTFKLLITIFVTLSVRKPIFTNSNSCCYSFHGEKVTDPVSKHFTNSLWEFYREKGLSVNPKFTLRILLILSGDIEICPGPRARCVKCTKCFRRNIDQRLCTGCNKNFHERCLSLVPGTCNTCKQNNVPEPNTVPIKRSLKELKSLCQLKGLKVVHQNIRGLFRNRDEIIDILNNFSINIFGVTETFLTPIFPSSFLKITGYALERRDRTSGIGGGVSAYIKDGTPFVRRHDLEDENIEGIWLEICYPNTKSFIIGIMYKPPDSSKHLAENFLNLLANRLSIIDTENKEVIILGDLNCDYLKNNDHLDIKQTFTVNGYSQLIKKATRITDKTNTLIDVIQTTRPCTISQSNVIPTDLSDHDMIGCVRKLHHIKSKPKTIVCRNYTQYDSDTVNDHLANENWDIVYKSTCPEKAWYYVKSILIKTLDRCAPYITKRVKGRTCAWLDNGIKKEMNTRDQLMRKARNTNREVDWSNYKRKRNYVKNAIKRAKNLHYTKLLNESVSKPEKFWKSIKEIFPTKSEIDRPASSFIINEKETSDKNIISNGFCKYFSSVAQSLKSKAFPLINCVWKYTKKCENRSSTFFQFRQVSVQEVNRHLKNLKRNKAVGLDNLPPGYLKDTANVIAGPLTHVINLSLNSGIIPNDFKMGRVMPIFKSGSVSNIDNYRPISILPILSKILEKCVHDQVMLYLESNHLLSIQQFGFRKNRSTELAATCFVDDVRKGMDRGELTGAVYIDLSKAFDTISHASILAKLPSFGIDGTPREWFTSYLFGRSQCVMLDGVLSTPQPIYCGVPQGSILGPLLFLLHFNDSSSNLIHCKIVKYADDTVMYVSHKSIEVIERLLNDDFTKFCSWLEDNELVINLKKGKTEFMIFGTSIRLSRLNDPPLNLCNRGVFINQTHSYKYLGISINSTLNMSNHFSMALKKASGRINLLKRVRYFINTNTAATIYKSMIIPTLTYCPLVTSCVSNTLLGKVEYLEGRARKIISSDIPSITAIYKKRLCTYVYKCLNGEVCENFIDYFDCINNPVQTRNNGFLVRLPKVRTESAKKGFYFVGAKTFNELPTNIRKAKNLKEFKYLINLYFK